MFPGAAGPVSPLSLQTQSQPDISPDNPTVVTAARLLADRFKQKLDPFRELQQFKSNWGVIPAENYRLCQLSWA